MDRLHVRFRRIIQDVSLALGLFLMAIYGVAMLHRSLESRAAISSFEAAQLTPDRFADVHSQNISLSSATQIGESGDNSTFTRGEPLAVLTIERLKIKAPVFAGTGGLALNRGLGWIAGTARPGEHGNSGIAGHRDSFFRALKGIAVGDAVDLQTFLGTFTYRIEEIEIVHPSRIDVLQSRGTSSLTLVTCFPFNFVGDAPQRFVVHGKLEKQVSMNSVRKAARSKSRPPI